MSPAKAAGLTVESTKPLSRAERRAAAARVHSEQQQPPTDTSESTQAAVTAASPQNSRQAVPQPATNPAEHPASPHDEPPPIVGLKPREKQGKRPFATQLRPSTLARLEWVKARGYAITDTVDDAINQYLDAAGIPPAQTSH